MATNPNISASVSRRSPHTPSPLPYSHDLRLLDPRHRTPFLRFSASHSFTSISLDSSWRGKRSNDVIPVWIISGLSPERHEPDGDLGVDVRKILSSANSVLPHVVLGSTVLALAHPPSFTWFTTRYYAPALGFLMFAVGVNSSPKDFVEAIKRPKAISAGYVGQFVIKPLLGYMFGTISMVAFNLSSSIGSGIMLTSCVSGAQLSNYATFLTDPLMAPLSIVMTSLSTATAVFVTPMLSLLLIGKKLPVDVIGMMSSIVQIVVAPIAAGLLLNRFLPRICDAIKILLPPLSVLVTALCVGSPLAINMKAIISPFGLTVLLLVTGFHAASFIAGYFLTGLVFSSAPDLEALKRTLSFETGMQSSLLALALANNFFQDPLVGVPPAISVVIMSLMGFFLVTVWSKSKQLDTLQ